MSQRSDISILIVENEALIADHIAVCLKELGYAVAGICDSGQEAFEYLSLTHPSLVLLDIQLGSGIDGVDIAHIINEKYRVPFVFLTSNADLKTIDRVKLTNPAGFIIKPYTPADLESGIEIALHTFSQQRRETSATDNENSLFVKEQHRFKRIDFKQILYVKANDNYTLLQTEAEQIVLSLPLKTIEEKLAGRGFVRTHRSYLVNLNKIESVNPKSVWVASEEIPLSDGYKTELMSRLNLLYLFGIK